MKSIDELRNAVEEKFSERMNDELAEKISAFVKIAFDSSPNGIECLFCGMPTIHVDGIYRDAMQKTGLIEAKPRPKESSFYHLTKKAYDFYRKALNGTARIKISKTPHRTDLKY